MVRTTKVFIPQWVVNMTLVYPHSDPMSWNISPIVVVKKSALVYGVFHSHGRTPSYHMLSSILVGFSLTNHLAIGVPPWLWKHPYYIPEESEGKNPVRSGPSSTRSPISGQGDDLFSARSKWPSVKKRASALGAVGISWDMNVYYIYIYIYIYM